jgi:hypothetical protein
MAGYEGLWAMATFIFPILMGLWLAAIATACLAARARLRQDEHSSAGRAALLVGLTHIPGFIRVGPDKDPADT